MSAILEDYKSHSYGTVAVGHETTFASFAVERRFKERPDVVAEIPAVAYRMGAARCRCCPCVQNLYQVVQYHRRLRRIAPGSLSGTSSGSEGASTEKPLTPGPPTRAFFARGGVESYGALVEKPQLNWTTAKWAFLAAWLPLLLAAGIVVVPSGMGGIRVSQTAGTRPGTLYPGVHFVRPLLDSVV